MRCGSRLHPLLPVLPWLLLLPVVLWGCGGGGGSSSSGGNAPVNVFVTDSFRDDFDHVWVTIHKVELLDAGGAAQTLFDDPEGRVIDLKTLRDASGERFTFLSTGSVPGGTYTGGRVTVGPTFNVIPKGSTTAQTLPVADDVARDAQGRPVVPFSLQGPRNIGSSGEPLVIDFDLANFSVVNGKLRPAIKHALGELLGDLPRHEHHRFEGVVSELSGAAPNQSFVLSFGEGKRIDVTTNENTAIYNADGTPNAALANGQRVKVEGIFDVAAHRLVASEIKIQPQGGEPKHAFVAGKPRDINPAGGSFVVLIRRAEGFVPTHDTVKVVTTDQTIFRADSGMVISAADFFAGLATADGVGVEGTYDAGSNTLTALSARLHHEHEPDHRVRAVGMPKEPNREAGTFVLNPVLEHEGFVPRDNRVNVVTTANTKFVDHHGNVITRAAFFELLPTALKVRVEGTYSAASNTITASLARIVDQGGDHHPATAVGKPVEVNRDARTFWLNPVYEHTGFDLRDGRVKIATNANTVFKDKNGAVITAGAFFELLANALKVRVEGNYDPETNTILALVAQIVQMEEHHPATAVGKPVEINREGRTFILNPVFEHTGFDLRDGRVKVATNENTVFKGKNGETLTAGAFYEMLPHATRVRVEGDHNPETNTILASLVRILEMEEELHDVSAVGAPKEVNTAAKTFDINPVTDHTGFTPPDNRVHVVTNANTVFKNREGQVVTAAQFFELLAHADRVRVEGKYRASTNTITALVAAIKPL
jgi:hypothetical protein